MATTKSSRLSARLWHPSRLLSILYPIQRTWSASRPQSVAVRRYRDRFPAPSLYTRNFPSRPQPEPRVNSPPCWHQLAPHAPKWMRGRLLSCVFRSHCAVKAPCKATQARIGTKACRSQHTWTDGAYSRSVCACGYVLSIMLCRVFDREIANFRKYVNSNCPQGCSMQLQIYEHTPDRPSFRTRHVSLAAPSCCAHHRGLLDLVRWHFVRWPACASRGHIDAWLEWRAAQHADAAFTPVAHLCHLSRVSAELGYA